ncbi:MAG: putative transposase [Solirubrobacteraceae bacterium]
MDQGTDADQLEGMPEPYRYWRRVQHGEVLVGFGARLLFRFDERDTGMRNLAVVALTEAGAQGKEVAALFGLTATYVSRLRRRAADGGSRALLPARGAPRKLSETGARRVLELSEAGHSGAEIARRVGVSQASVSRLLARRRGAAVAQGELELALGSEHAGEPGGGEQPALSDPALSGPVVAVTRVGEREVHSRYAGAMLLYPFLERLGAEAVLGSLPAGPARRYDAPALVLGATFGFALGSGSLEQTKHLAPPDAGALVGLCAFPALRTLRPRLAALAEASDPLAVQRSFATAMLSADERPPELFYVDDHFVTYWGAKPVAKGYNIRRHLAEPGRDDTFVVDDRWRAICFASGEPRGLSVSLPEVLGQLKAITGERPVMVGFDRGGSYPKTFNAIAGAGIGWITWRRAPLPPAGVEPRRSWVQVNGKRRSYLLADEHVSLGGYEHGPVRQLSAHEHGKLVFQVLTSNHQLKGASLVHRLKSRWCIENTNKYLEAHQQIHWLSSYEMDVEQNTAKVQNPARKTARADLKAAEAALADAERALGHAAHTNTPQLKQLRAQITAAEAQLTAARAALKPIPAKLPANMLDPNAKRATPRLARRSLQMVCRLLAYNAELDLARRLNTYLADPDEYRTIARHLLHLDGTINYQARAITVTLDRPHPPRVARALSELVAEINAEPAHLPGDRRPISYRLKD